MSDICLPMPTAEEARAAFGNDFDPDQTLNGAIALAGPNPLSCSFFSRSNSICGLTGAWMSSQRVSKLKAPIRYRVNASTLACILELPWLDPGAILRANCFQWDSGSAESGTSDAAR